MSAEQAVALVAELERRGVRLALDGDRIRFRPKAAVTPELLERLAVAKPAVVALLRAEGTTTARNARTRGERTLDGPLWECRACGGLKFWALAHVRYWVCEGCHEPCNPQSELIWTKVRPASAWGGSDA